MLKEMCYKGMIMGINIFDMYNITKHTTNQFKIYCVSIDRFKCKNKTVDNIKWGAHLLKSNQEYVIISSMTQIKLG